MNKTSIRELIYRSVSGYAMAVYALREDIDTYDKDCFHLQEIAYGKLKTGMSTVPNILDEYHVPYIGGRCVYCGRQANTVDHIIPQAKKGTDSPDNLILCCKHCNSSKSSKDLMDWMCETHRFPPLCVVEGYLRMIYSFCQENQILDSDLNDDFEDVRLPFSLDRILIKYPSPKILSYYKSQAIPLDELTLVKALDDIDNISTKKSLKKIFADCSINTWSDLGKEGVYKLRDYILSTYSRNAAKTHFAEICALLWRYDAIKQFYKEYRSVLYANKEKFTPICLTNEEIIRFSSYVPKSSKEQFVKDSFLLCISCGVKPFTTEFISLDGIKDGVITYSIGTSKRGRAISVSLENPDIELLRRVKASDGIVTLAGYNKILQRIAGKVGITSNVAVSKKGENIVIPKCKGISSRTAWDTYLARNNKVNSDEGILKDSAYKNGLKHYIEDRIINSGISVENLASKLNINAKDLIGVLQGKQQTTLDFIDSVLEILH